MRDALCLPFLDVQELSAFYFRMNKSTSFEDVKNALQLLDLPPTKIPLPDFKLLCDNFRSYPRETLNALWTEWAGGAATLDAKTLIRFFKEVQHQDLSLSEAQRLMTFFARPGIGEAEASRTTGFRSSIDRGGFFALLSDLGANGADDPAHAEVYHDMTRPLADYYISASHNTYLSGNQLTDEGASPL
jgi:phosphatidylinositol phospholipase C delta